VADLVRRQTLEIVAVEASAGRKEIVQIALVAGCCEKRNVGARVEDEIAFECCAAVGGRRESVARGVSVNLERSDADIAEHLTGCIRSVKRRAVVHTHEFKLHIRNRRPGSERILEHGKRRALAADLAENTRQGWRCRGCSSVRLGPGRSHPASGSR
jgi:hypothetical protein